MLKSYLSPILNAYLARMHRKTVFTLLFFYVCPAFTWAQTTGQPNVVLIMADQAVPFLMGAYGHRVVQTPNLDRLTQRGVRFDSAYTPNPICAPARACLLTGKYSSVIGVHDNAAPLACDEPTVCHYLVNAGYETVLSGKMHFVGPDQYHGFAKRLSRDIYPTDFTWVKSRTKKEPKEHAYDYFGDHIWIGKPDLQAGVDEQGKERFGNLAMDEEAHWKALEYLQRKGREKVSSPQKAQPFFLCVSYNYPHEPFWAPQPLWELYKDAEIALPQFPADLETRYSVMDRWLNRHHGVDKFNIRHPASLRKLRGAYYALMTYIDNKVGDLVKSLEENNLAENTIVIFTSDHGDMLGEKGMVQKRSFYEWSSRVPLIFSFPDGKYAGKIVKQPVSLVDVLPTLLELTGSKEDERLPVDGQSLLGLMNGRTIHHPAVFSEMHTEGVYATCFMVRRGQYKYIYIHGHESQLFDLVADPAEWNNLAGQRQYRKLESELRLLIQSRFNPESIEKKVSASIANRMLIKSAMQKNQTHWNFTPD